MAKNQHEPWKFDELEYLSNVTMSHRMVADKTGRSYSAVKAKRVAAGIKAVKMDINYWGIGEETVIVNNPHLSNVEIAKILNKTVQAVQLKRSRLGLQAPSDFWSEQELHFLTENYHKMKKKEIADKIKRSESAVMTKAYELGITAKKDTWSKKEIAYLIENINQPADVLSTSLNKTPNQIIYKQTYLRSRSKKKISPDILKEIDNDVPLPNTTKSDRYADLLEIMEIDQSFEFPSSESQHVQTAKYLFPHRLFKMKVIDTKTNRIWRLL